MALSYFQIFIAAGFIFALCFMEKYLLAQGYRSMIIFVCILGALATTSCFLLPYFLPSPQNTSTKEEAPNTITSSVNTNTTSVSTDNYSTVPNKSITHEADNSVSTQLEETDLPYLYYISENHTPADDYYTQIRLNRWAPTEDIDISRKSHNLGLKFYIHDFHYLEDESLTSTEVFSEFHYSIDKEALQQLDKSKQDFTGKFVIHRDTNGSPSTASISMFLDGIEVYNSGELSAYSLDIPSFKFSLRNKTELVIKINSTQKGEPFIIGLIDEREFE